MANGFYDLTNFKCQFWSTHIILSISRNQHSQASSSCVFRRTSHCKLWAG